MRRQAVLQLFTISIIGISSLGTACGEQGAEPASDSLVLQHSREHGEARVVVALIVPAAQSPEGVALADLQRQIRETQDEVLNALDSNSYRDPYLFEAVPAMTLTILAEAALRALETHGKVAKVSLDAGGVGHD